MIRIRGSPEFIFASLLMMSPAAGILFHTAGLMSLRVGLLLLTPPALVAAIALALRASHKPDARLAVYGLLGGAAATVAYDAVRIVLSRLGGVAQPFQSIAAYGLLIAGPDHARFAQSVGWLFHFWNGATFGMFYALAFQPTILSGILWGLFLELALVLTSPKLLALTIQGELLQLSLVGHIAYGATLALIVFRGSTQAGPGNWKGGTPNDCAPSRPHSLS